MRNPFALLLVAVAVCASAAAATSPSRATQELHHAVAKNDLALVKRALSEGANIDANDGPGGQSPLMAAVLQGHTAVVEHLLKAGANPAVAEKDGYTPVHGAGFQGRAEVMRVLLAHGLDARDVHRDGYQAIHRAAWGNERRHTDTIRVLLDAGVDPETLDRDHKKRAFDMTRNKASQQLLAEWAVLRAATAMAAKGGPAKSEL